MKKISKRLFALLLAVVMLIGIMPASAIATGETATTGSVTNYDDFITNLKVLEGYAKEYAAEIYGKDPGELVLNFIRTGVERYQDDNWNTLAGQENTGFTNYVAAQDAEIGTTAMNLKNIVIDEFTLPNNNQVDFGHMFGCMNISYVASGSADLSGWAGDICDLLQYSVKNIADINANTDGSVEEMAAYVQENCFGVDASGAFGWDDFWGDMDAYYLVSEYKKANGEKTFSELMEAYFTAGLNDTTRTVYFMNNRFAVADSKEAVRKAIYESYSNNVSIGILEADRGLASYSALRQACCYAVADYIYDKAQGKLIEGTVTDEAMDNDYYKVFSTERSTLAPGITQDIKYAQTVDGKQIVYYVATVDVKRDDVDLLVNYNNNLPPVGTNIGLQSVRGQVEALVKNNADKGNFYPIVATNGAGYNITNGTPGGLVVMQGVEYSSISAPGFFAILQDGTAVIGDVAKYNELKKEGLIKEAIQAFGSVLVKDGKISVTKSANYTSSRASRTAIGITDEGKVVMMVLDGRQLPRSAGGALEEIAQIMVDAGCVQAVNLDGGGSTTYMSRPAGSDEIDVINVPSDGYERRVSTSLVAVSTAAPSTAFDHAIVSSNYEYITVDTSMQFTATGVSNTGNAAPIPDGASWSVSDTSIATIDANGLFTAKATGDVTVQFMVNGEVKGSKKIHVVIPDNITFAESRITAIYGEPKKIDISVWYQGYPVAFTPLRDAFVFFGYKANENGFPVFENGQPVLYFTSNAGKINGLEFVGSADNEVRTATIYAAIMPGGNIIATSATVSLYYEDEATFDFANATMGNRSFAWTREIENARTLDNQLYYVSDPDSPVVIDYTFALDMTAIDFPAQLEPMKSMLPTYNKNSTAWDYLLQLAERVCTQTNVSIRAEFSKDIDVDISNLKIITEYFTFDPKDINLDPNNVLTIVGYWKNQSQPIDPATANPMCILTGIKATVKDSAAYYENKLAITNNGTVSYDIYLAASSLYSYAQKPENQAKFNLYPYIHDEDCRSDFVTEEPEIKDESGETTESEDTSTDGNENNNDKGARFSNQYIDFADSYLINSNSLNGWHEEDGDYYYYVNNNPVTGTQFVPDRHDSTQNRFYEFDATGKLVSEDGTTGLVEVVNANNPLGYDLYYANLGVAETGWQIINGNNYYFDPDTGKAVNGKCSIKEFIFPESADKDPNTAYYNYTFKNYILDRGDLRKDNIYGQTGWRYRWAGNWLKACWFEVDGNMYNVTKNYSYIITTGFGYYIKDYRNGLDTVGCYLFDENGVLQKNFAGPKEVSYTAYINEEWVECTDTFFFKNGKRFDNEIGDNFSYGLQEGSDGYYYYVKSWDGSIVMNATNYEVTEARANDLVVAGNYDFDEYGRLIDPLINKDTEIAVPAATKVDKADITVIGRVINVAVEDNKTPVVCKVVYKTEDNTYVQAPVAETDEGYSFATEFGATEIQFIVAGDIDTDGQLDLSDLHDLKGAVLGTNELDAVEAIAADVNGDGVVDIIDIILMAKSLTEGEFQTDLKWEYK